MEDIEDELFMSVHLPQWIYYQGLCKNQVLAAGIYIVVTTLAQALGRDITPISSTYTAQEPTRIQSSV